MSTATAIEKPIRETDVDKCVAFYAVGWAGYMTLLRLRGEHSEPRMVYLDGTIWLKSHSFTHERMKKRLGWVVDAIVVELGISFISAGSTTFRRRPKRAGLEGDQTYYLANDERIRGKDNLHLKTDPPPDLTIEVALSHDANEAIEVYRRFKVPVVWVCDEHELRILVLQPNGRYAKSATSAAFPFLTAAEVYDWVRSPQPEPDTAWIIELRTWVKQTLKPRVHGREQVSGQQQNPTT
jgi:Uma2 family endonuclease